MNDRDFHRYVDFEQGLVDRRIFSDPDIYDLEMEQIFARSWNFVAHESQIPEIGDYFMNWIGADQVIVVRNKQAGISVLINSCRHRGAAVCRAEQGNTRTFLCPYHGWSYGLDGQLTGVPGLRDFYRGDLDRASLSLRRAAQVESFAGFVFATMDPDAVPLEEYLGDVGRDGLSMIAIKGDLEIVDGVQKNVVGCNWKLAVDNLFDWYHPPFSHRSAIESGYNPGLANGDRVFKPQQQMVLLGDYGHAISGPMWTEQEMQAARAGGEPADSALPERLALEVERTMGPAGVRSHGHPNIFPNLWITPYGHQVCLRIPRGPSSTELWWFTFIDRNASAGQRRGVVRIAARNFGPAGMLEQDDGENWELATRGTMGPISRLDPLHFGMASGHDQVRETRGQAHIETRINEHGQRWTYQSWADWMTARSWAELKANRTRVPSGRI